MGAVMQPFDFVLTFANVLASSISTRTKTVQVNVSSLGPFDTSIADDELNNGEVAEDAPVYSGLGLLCRPLDPETISGKAYSTEVVCARTADGLVPMAYRDLRLCLFFPNGIPKGRVSLVGYGGGFHTIDLTASNSGDRKSNIHTLYAPYAFAAGVPTKAMCVTLDTTPGGEHLSMSIGGGVSGYQLTMNETDGIQMRSPSNDQFFQFWVNGSNSEITMTAKKIMLKGNVYVGASAETGVPLLPGVASPPCPSLFVSPA